jgi:hypothetical protein
VQLFLADGAQLQCAWTSRENLQRTPPDITICPWKNGFQSNFPERNRLMAAISDATVIFEASATSGSLHQAAECVRLDRWLFIAESLRKSLVALAKRFCAVSQQQNPKRNL